MADAGDTLYLKNLNDSVRTNEMRRTLYLVATAFGLVTDVRYHKSAKGRGQAWITFADRQTTVLALQQLSGMTIYEKPISAHFAAKKTAAGKKRA
mmetsp:Transcript_12260/g.38150  ORF Transcript_12260/g.38150 Transcript_12260/m.38150 type:complete len:95 (+) Transcript_12260:45-329(+)